MLTSCEVSFYGMTIHFGEVVAYGHLEQIELAAGISPREMVGLDPEVRLVNALRTQDAMRVAA